MKLSIFLFIIFIIQFLLSVPYYSGDVKNHLVWADSLLNQGTLGFYEREFHDFAFPNYPPLSMFLFALSLKIYQLTNQLSWYLNINVPIFPSNLVYFFQLENVQISFLKLPAIIANFGIAFFIYLFFKRNKKYLVLFLFNPVSIYLSVIWGQIDMLPIFFLIAALYFMNTKIYMSIFLISLAMLSKQTVIVFVPLYLLLILKNYNYTVLLQTIILFMTIFYIAYLPFHQFSLTWPLELYKTNFNLVAHSVGENAINLWGFLFDFKRISDQKSLFFINFQQWGYLLFSMIIAWPTMVFIKKTKSHQKIFEYLLLITLIYFFVLTRMHERYLTPAIVFSTILVIMNKKYIVSLITISFICLINLYRGLLQPDIPLFNYLISSLIFLKFLVIGYGLLIMYHLYIFTKEESNV